MAVSYHVIPTEYFSPCIFRILTVSPVSGSVYTYLDENRDIRIFSYLLTAAVPTVEKKRKKRKMKNEK